MRRILAVALVVLGVLGIGLGLLGSTIWAPDTQRTATVSLSDPGSAVVIDPGVVYVGGHEGSVTITAAKDVTVTPASMADIQDYLGDAEYTRITGVPSWTTLGVQKVNGDGEAEIPDPASADLFASHTTSKSPATLNIADLWAAEGGARPAQPFRGYLVTTDGKDAAAQSVTITWPHDATNAWVPYATAAGAVLAVIGLVLFALDFSAASARRRRAAEEIEDEEIVAARLSSGSSAAPALGAAGVSDAAEERELLGEDVEHSEDDPSGEDDQAHEDRAGEDGDREDAEAGGAARTGRHRALLPDDPQRGEPTDPTEVLRPVEDAPSADLPDAQEDDHR